MILVNGHGGKEAGLVCEDSFDSVMSSRKVGYKHRLLSAGGKFSEAAGSDHNAVVSGTLFIAKT